MESNPSKAYILCVFGGGLANVISLPLIVYAWSGSCITLPTTTITLFSSDGAVVKKLVNAVSIPLPVTGVDLLIVTLPDLAMSFQALPS